MSLIAVLIPLLFMGDVVGRLFHEFAITLSVTIVISAVVSLTLVPMMCARLVRHRPDAQRSRFDLAAERGFNWVIGRYDRALNVVLDHQPLTLLVAVLTLVVTVLLYIVVPKGFFPVQDTGVIQGISVAAQTASFDAMAEHQQALADGDPEGPRRRQPEFVHRRRRQQHDAEHRPLPDQPEAEGRPRAERHRDRPAAAAGDRRCRRACRCICSRCRT